jgi:threonine dehydratase
MNDRGEKDLQPADLREARVRVAHGARMTPLLPSDALSERCGVPVALKCENLQVGGAFKIRGATNFIAGLAEAGRTGGVITYSSGNHAIAVATAARRHGMAAVVVMPRTVTELKLARVKELGAEVNLAGTTSLERRARAEAIAAERGLAIVPPFDDARIIAGQASCGVEILEQWPEVAAVLVPVGGGGLLSGVALACGYHRAGVRVIGVEPEGAAKMSASLRAGAAVTLPSPVSIADGLLPSRPGDLTFSLVRRFVEQVVTVSDAAIHEAAAFLLQSEHLLVEWSGAAAVAALRAGGVRLGGVPIVAVLSGGNADPRAILAPLPTLQGPPPRPERVS